MICASVANHYDSDGLGSFCATVQNQSLWPRAQGLYGPDILYIHEVMILSKPMTPVTNLENVYFWWNLGEGETERA
jgi:hypothetical protein